MSFSKSVSPIQILNPMFQIGCFIDILTGTYYLDERGDSNLNGGLPDMFGIVGVMDSWKTTVLIKFNINVLDRYAIASSTVYDSEATHKYMRINELAADSYTLKDIDFCNPDDINRYRFTITSFSEVDELGRVQWLDIMMDNLGKYATQKSSNKKPTLYTTPFIEGSSFITIREVDIVNIDSFGQSKISTIENGVKTKNKVGDSEQNTASMDEGRYKTNINNLMPSISRRGEIRFGLTTHIQKETNMEGKFAVKKEKLTHTKSGYELKGVGTSYQKLCSWIIEINKSEKFDNETANTGVYYPLVESDRSKDCKDLNLLTCVMTRNKNGAHGTSFKYVVSQREGLKEHLSMFHHLKENKWGLVSDSFPTALILRPDVKLNRTTVRGIIDNDYLLKRALEIETDMYWMGIVFSPAAKEHLCTPKELYEDIIKLGYNWDTLLGKTRGYWIPREFDNDNLPPLSTMSLLRMRKGIYTPFWLKTDYINSTSGFLKETLLSIPPKELKG